MASALASLTANYTDSEGEDERHVEREDDETESGGLHPSLAERLGKLGKDSGNQSSPGSSGSSSHPRQTSDSQGGTPTKKAKLLVSYIDPDAGLSDDERDSVPMDLESDDEDKENGIDAMIVSNEDEELDEKERSHCMEELWEGGVKLPPEPRGDCSRELQEKFDELHRKKVEMGYDYNKMIQKKKAFRNPSIYEKLILFCEIDELGTNFPPELYDGHLFGKESYYDELARSQKEEMDRREKALEARKKSGDNRTKESAPVVSSRKSKWDQQGPGVPAKVIPAFGALKRK